MKILVFNSGSSSIKFKLYALNEQRSLAWGMVEKIGEDDGHVTIESAVSSSVVRHRVAVSNHHEGFLLLKGLLKSLAIVQDFNTLGGIGHRVVHGGEFFDKAVIIDADVRAKIEALIPLAPLHNPANLMGIEVMSKLAPTVRQVAVFDTAFHQSMPKESYLYALPYALYEAAQIRRYGFHGTSHSYVAKVASKMLKRPLEQLNLITLHLGNGASVTAIENGKSIDTSMGMTPLEGLMMGTRSGDFDPAVVLYLMRHEGMHVDEIDALLNRQSGLKGICGVNDMREVLDAANKGSERAALAVQMFVRRLQKYIGAYVALLGSVDALVFTGGIGEHATEIREKTCEILNKSFGIVLDKQKNIQPKADAFDISAKESKIKVFVVSTDEEREIAEQTQELLN